MNNLNVNIPQPVAFCFKNGRRERLVSGSRSPGEFYYGMLNLQDMGVDVRLLDESDLGISNKFSFLSRVFARVFNILFQGIPTNVILQLLRRKNRSVLNAGHCIVVTTNTLGLYFSVARRLGIINIPIIFLAMGLLPKSCGQWTRLIYRALLCHTNLVAISKGEQAYLEKILNLPVRYLQFGVDHIFWRPIPTYVSSDYILAIGNDRHRDWATLVSAWTQDLPLLRIITKLPVPDHGPNIEIIPGDWSTQIFSDEQIREQFLGASFVILPLFDTYQPSGQSACLQAMACGKAVILSDIDGIWDRDLIIHNHNILLVPPGNIDALNGQIKRLLTDSSLRNDLGMAARRTIEGHLNVDQMAENLCKLLSDNSVVDVYQ